MCERKTDEESKKEYRKNMLIAASIVFVVVFVTYGACIKFGLGFTTSDPMGSDPITWEEFVPKIPQLLVGSVVGSVLFLYLGFKK